MSDTGIIPELKPGIAVIELLFVVGILLEIGVLSARRWAGQVVPDYSGWKPQDILTDQRCRLGLGLSLAAA
jgi:hypothetical protein